MAATRMKDRARDAYEHVWRRIEPALGHLYVEQIDTSALDAFKRRLPPHLGPRSINHHLILIRAVLRFLWKRSRLKGVPYVPMESVPKKHVDWYTRQERDQLLEGFFRLEPQWYLFYYLTTRLGLRTGEVYAIALRQFRHEPPQLVVDQAVQRGTKTRDARLAPRKNDEAYVLDLTSDVLAAVDWHVGEGYAGPDFLFSKTGVFPRYIDSHVRPLKLVQQKLGLRMLSHHKVGRHSVASQAVTGGESVKAVQAQLGHRSEQSTHQYAHLGSGAQRRLVEALKPAHAPHERSMESELDVLSRVGERIEVRRAEADATDFAHFDAHSTRTATARRGGRTRRDDDTELSSADAQRHRNADTQKQGPADAHVNLASTDPQNGALGDSRFEPPAADTRSRRSKWSVNAEGSADAQKQASANAEARTHRAADTEKHGPADAHVNLASTDARNDALVDGHGNVASTDAGKHLGGST
jgi:integrase